MSTYFTLDQVTEQLRYPAGEGHVRLRSEHIELFNIRTIEATATSFNDLGTVITTDRILRRLGRRVEWFLPYFPFARHDRRNDALDGFELGLALEMVAELDLVIADPHSDVAGQLRHFDQASVVDRFIHAGLFDTNPTVIIPDAGATKKAYAWLDGRPVVQALKHRDPATGRLSGFNVLTDDLHGRPCIIVDDICDGGGTFLGLANQLKAANAGPLTLAVTHGLFTKGTTQLAETFSTLACLTPSQADPDDLPDVTTIPFRDLYTKGSIT